MSEKNIFVTKSSMPNMEEYINVLKLFAEFENKRSHRIF